MLVYAVGADHPLRGPCRAIVKAAGTLGATTTVEVIQEFVHVRARRRSRADACEIGAAYVELLSPLLAPGRAELEEGLRLYRSDERLDAFDAVLAAAARQAGASTIFSADSAFAGIERLTHVDPADTQALTRLGILDP